MKRAKLLLITAICLTLSPHANAQTPAPGFTSVQPTMPFNVNTPLGASVNIMNLTATSMSVNGAVKVGSTNATCTNALAGMIRYNGPATGLEYCNGTAWAAPGRQCSYTYKEIQLGGHGGNYATLNYVDCINNIPTGYQFIGYDVCFEDGNYCTVDGLMCFYSKETCS